MSQRIRWCKQHVWAPSSSPGLLGSWGLYRRRQRDVGVVSLGHRLRNHASWAGCLRRQQMDELGGWTLRVRMTRHERLLTLYTRSCGPGTVWRNGTPLLNDVLFRTRRTICTDHPWCSKMFRRKDVARGPSDIWDVQVVVQAREDGDEKQKKTTDTPRHPVLWGPEIARRRHTGRAQNGQRSRQKHDVIYISLEQMKSKSKDEQHCSHYQVEYHRH